MGSKVTFGEELLFPSDYISAADCAHGDLTLTVAKINKEELVMRGGGKKTKPVLTFRETIRGKPGKLVLNVTNAESVAAMYGTKAESWLGKQITFFATKTKFGRETVDCLRVREQVPAKTPEPVQVDPEIAALVETWGTALSAPQSEHDIATAFGEWEKLQGEARRAIWKVISLAAKRNGFQYDTESRRFIALEPVPA